MTEKLTTTRFRGHDMRRVPLFLMFVIAALSSGCAEIGACPPGQRLVDGRCTRPPDACPPSITKPIQVGCVTTPILPGEPTTSFTYELTVEPGPIVSGTPFGAFFEGRALLGADTLNAGAVALGSLGSGIAFRRVELGDFQATVQVRAGAQGDDVVLKASPIQYTCTYDENGITEPEAVPPFPECSPGNDRIEGGNDDCTGLDGVPHPENPCLPYLELVTNDDCTLGGVCDGAGQMGLGSPCELNGFCVTDDAEIRLGQEDGAYIADPSGSVLFGWADKGFLELAQGPNRGAYDPSRMRVFSYDFPPGPNGFRVRIGVLELAFECVMGEISRGPDGVPTVDPLTSRSPDGVLISCPIQEPD